MTCSPWFDPVTMRVQKLQKGTRRRTLEVGQGLLTRTDRPQAASGRSQARHQLHHPGGGQGALGISEATFHRWRKRYGTMSSQEAKRLKELERENARLKKLVAEQALDIDILKEVNRGNF